MNTKIQHRRRSAVRTSRFGACLRAGTGRLVMSRRGTRATSAMVSGAVSRKANLAETSRFGGKIESCRTSSFACAIVQRVISRKILTTHYSAHIACAYEAARGFQDCVECTPLSTLMVSGLGRSSPYPCCALRRGVPRPPAGRVRLRCAQTVGPLQRACRSESRRPQSRAGLHHSRRRSLRQCSALVTVPLRQQVGSYPSSVQLTFAQRRRGQTQPRWARRCCSRRRLCASTSTIF